MTKNTMYDPGLNPDSGKNLSAIKAITKKNMHKMDQVYRLNNSIESC